MKKHFLFFLFAALIAPSLGGQSGLPAEYKDWLDSVKPIIRPTERDVFLKLSTKSDRDKFIQFFWKQREPHPDASENEFYKEYMARIRFADQTFHDETSQKGHLTERGFYYLLLGAPLERHIYATYSQFWPVEVWFYKGEEQYGLPAYFYLMFYQPQGFGPYKLFSPSVDGPERLAIPTMSNGTLTRQNAYQTIKEVASEVASASLSYIPGERPLTMASFSSDTLVANVRGLPEKKYSDAYARSYLDFKDHVETEYSHNYVDCSAMVRVFSRGGQFFADWTVEPSKMNFDSSGNVFFASYELVLKLERPDGTTLLERTEEIPFRVTPEQFKAHERQRVAFQDVLPVVPGEARLFLLLKNKTARDFMSFQARLSVPTANSGPGLGDMLLYHVREEMPAAQKKNIEAFALDGRRYAFNARNEFLAGEELGCVAQSLRPSGALAAAAFQLDIMDMGMSAASSQAKPKPPFFSRRSAARDVLNAQTGSVDFGPVSLASIAPGYYQAVLTMLDGADRPLQVRKENFIVLSNRMPVLPWVFARQHPAFPNPEQLYLLGTQYFLGGDYASAKDVLDKASAMRDEPRVKLLLGRTLYGLRRYADSIGVLDPLYKAKKDRDAGKALALDHFSLGEWGPALELCQELLREGTEVSVLNVAGECCVRLDDPDQAVPLLRKSLEIDPAQPAVRALLEKALKK
ncbi:MAG: GWxTD domain-containing protein [Candidatus Aminicenantales bacterium]